MSRWGAILKKIAIFQKVNALRVIENGQFPIRKCVARDRPKLNFKQNHTSNNHSNKNTPTKITPAKITTPKIRPTRITLPTKSHQQKSHKNFLLFVSFRSGTALRVVGSGRGAGDIGRERDPRIAVCRRCGAVSYIGRGPGLLAEWGVY